VSLALLLVASMAGLASPGTPPAAPAPAAPAAPAHSREYWREIVKHEYAVPAGASPIVLLRELSGYFSSPDAELRDELAAGIAEQWIFEQKLLAPAELRELLTAWTANLKVGLGESGTDSVFLRSFSALGLSNIAAVENQKPFLTAAEFEGLLTATLDYLNGEKDVRGYDPQKGWIHSAAHTADILTSLGRSRYLKPADQGRILTAIGRKMDNPGGVFTHGEESQLAEATLSLVRRPDFDSAAFAAMTDGFLQEAKPLWQGRLDPRRFAAVENSKHFLRSLYVQLALVAAAKPSPGLAPTQAKILACLAAMM